MVYKKPKSYYKNQGVHQSVHTRQVLKSYNYVPVLDSAGLLHCTSLSKRMLQDNNSQEMSTKSNNMLLQ